MSPKVTRFSKSFIIEETEQLVEFHPVNTAYKQLYQIYIPLAGKPYRIHMQKNDQGRFEIAAKDQVPAHILELENEFEAAIIQS
ncbi:hypothetical protein [Chitinophaga tropicalis]|uniref:Uncharacterized protein n=1 Tax=Chitinophaga tropicalis TaxID=2683588 RepID=A0A7K1TZZ0_9BACT|nr:hypothetical protein [Chitinophaga tropicalis]MVT07678.1 hypothetical protein [Chitinophaga tropicalis]